MTAKLNLLYLLIIFMAYVIIGCSGSDTSTTSYEMPGGNRQAELLSNDQPISPTVQLQTPTTTSVIPTLPTATATPVMVISVVSLTSPIAPGEIANVKIQTEPGAKCSIDVILKSGSSKADGLKATEAGSDGICKWSWKIGPKTAQGTWEIKVYATLGEKSVSISTPFEVKE